VPEALGVRVLLPVGDQEPEGVGVRVPERLVEGEGERVPPHAATLAVLPARQALGQPQATQVALEVAAVAAEKVPAGQGVPAATLAAQ
jgi:hypothetical protein